MKILVYVNRLFFMAMLVPINFAIAQQTTETISLNKEILNSQRSSEEAASIDKQKPKLTFDAKIEQRFKAEWNYNLDEEDKEEIVGLEPKFSLGMKYKASTDLTAYLSLEYARELETEITDDAQERNYESTLALDEMYVRITDLFRLDGLIKKTSLTLGRFKLSDKREWFYDQNLDGILMSFEVEPLDTQFDISFNKEEIIGSDLLRRDEDDTVNNFILAAQRKPFGSLDISLSAFAIVRDDSSDKNDSPRFYGLSANGKLADERIHYWADFGWAFGKDDDETIKGHGFDVGLTLLRNKTGVNLTVGYAYGSGNGDRDTDFRQTGLEGNSDKYAGVSSFKYYGELFDPELSNMHIFTAGVGYRFSKTASVDLVYHRYEQDTALDRLRGGDIDADPDGQNKELGEEIDLVLGYTTASKVETELVLGYFHPGAAYGNDADDAALIKASLSYRF